MEADGTGPDRVVSLYLRPRNGQSSASSPDRIRCFIGGEWKPRSEYSGRQLERFTRSGAPPENSQISCRVHSTQTRREIRCEGPCAKYLPVECFSKNTRIHGKTWCLDCTDWQLSVEPGYAPYVPPPSGDEVDDGHLLEDDSADTVLSDEAPGERIEEWIQGNPSELGDYDRVEIGTQRSVIDSASEVSGPTLLDSYNHELGGLPQALNAVNLSRVGFRDLSRPSYASVASTGRAAPDSDLRPDQPISRVPHLGMPSIGKNTGPTSEASQSRYPSAAPTLTGSTVQSPSLNQSTISGASTVWMESEFSALAIAQRQLSQRPDTGNGWARPCQRRTEFVLPRYVTNSRDQDQNRPQVAQKQIYADVDDDDSEDEC